MSIVYVWIFSQSFSKHWSSSWQKCIICLWKWPTTHRVVSISNFYPPPKLRSRSKTFLLASSNPLKQKMSSPVSLLIWFVIFLYRTIFLRNYNSIHGFIGIKFVISFSKPFTFWLQFLHIILFIMYWKATHLMFEFVFVSDQVKW